MWWIKYLEKDRYLDFIVMGVFRCVFTETERRHLHSEDFNCGSLVSALCYCLFRPIIFFPSQTGACGGHWGPYASTYVFVCPYSVSMQQLISSPEQSVQRKPHFLRFFIVFLTAGKIVNCHQMSIAKKGKYTSIVICAETSKLMWFTFFGVQISIFEYYEQNAIEGRICICLWNENSEFKSSK